MSTIAANQVQDNFKTQFGIHLKHEWVEHVLQTIIYHGQTRTLSAEQVSQEVFEQFLFNDLNVIGSPCLPEDVKTWNEAVLMGRHVLQVDEIINVAAPAKERYGGQGLPQHQPSYMPSSSASHRCLKLLLSDGVRQVSAVEYRSLGTLLNWDCPAGAKVLLCDVPVRRGLLMLQPENVAVLGGQVERLEAARQKAVAAWNKPPVSRPRGEGPRNVVEEARAAAWQPSNLAAAAAPPATNPPTGGASLNEQNAVIGPSGVSLPMDGLPSTNNPFLLNQLHSHSNSNPILNTTAAPTAPSSLSSLCPSDPSCDHNQQRTWERRRENVSPSPEPTVDRPLGLSRPFPNVVGCTVAPAAAAAPLPSAAGARLGTTVSGENNYDANNSACAIPPRNRPSGGVEDVASHATSTIAGAGGGGARRGGFISAAQVAATMGRMPGIRNPMQPVAPGSGNTGLGVSATKQAPGEAQPGASETSARVTEAGASCPYTYPLGGSSIQSGNGSTHLYVPPPASRTRNQVIQQQSTQRPPLSGFERQWASGGEAAKLEPLDIDSDEMLFADLDRWGEYEGSGGGGGSGSGGGSGGEAPSKRKRVGPRVVGSEDRFCENDGHDCVIFVKGEAQSPSGAAEGGPAAKKSRGITYFDSSDEDIELFEEALSQLEASTLRAPGGSLNAGVALRSGGDCMIDHWRASSSDEQGRRHRQQNSSLSSWNQHLHNSHHSPHAAGRRGAPSHSLQRDDDCDAHHPNVQNLLYPDEPHEPLYLDVDAHESPYPGADLATPSTRPLHRRRQEVDLPVKQEEGLGNLRHERHVTQRRESSGGESDLSVCIEDPPPPEVYDLACSSQPSPTLHGPDPDGFGATSGQSSNADQHGSSKRRGDGSSTEGWGGALADAKVEHRGLTDPPGGEGTLTGDVSSIGLSLGCQPGRSARAGIGLPSEAGVDDRHATSEPDALFPFASSPMVLLCDCGDVNHLRTELAKRELSSLRFPSRSSSWRDTGSRVDGGLEPPVVPFPFQVRVFGVFAEASSHNAWIEDGSGILMAVVANEVASSLSGMDFTQLLEWINDADPNKAAAADAAANQLMMKFRTFTGEMTLEFSGVEDPPRLVGLRDDGGGSEGGEVVGDGARGGGNLLSEAVTDLELWVAAGEE